MRCLPSSTAANRYADSPFIQSSSGLALKAYQCAWSVCSKAVGFLSNFQATSQLVRMTITTYDKRASSSSPPAGHKLDPATPIETTEQLRIAIDQGHGGDKVDASDPAAAPLGTDDEAGGTPNSTSQVRVAAAHEVRAGTSSARQRTSGLGAAWWLIGFTLATGVSIIISVLFLKP
jgi:hypothetical protein